MSCRADRRSDPTPNDIDGLWNAVGLAIDDISPAECLNYFRNAGYGRA